MNYAATSFSSPLAHQPQRPRLNGYGSPSSDVQRTKILLLGMRRAGKTSIQQVLFNNLPPKQTFYLETTMRIIKVPIDTVVPLELWDCPANTTVESLGVPLSSFAAIIFVIDIRDLYNQPISKLVEFIVASYDENPGIALEVFVHKAEKLQEDDKIENFRQIHERVSDRLLDISPDYEQMQLNFHLTSVYDHSLHEAFSRVLHKLISSLPYLEELLNVFCSNSQSPKAFLFDTRSRLYVATDASPVDSATHNLCCDYLQMLNSFGPLYKSITVNPAARLGRVESAPSIPRTPPPSAVTSPEISTAQNAPRRTSYITPLTPQQNPPPDSSTSSVGNGAANGSRSHSALSNSPSSRRSAPHGIDEEVSTSGIPNLTRRHKEFFYPSAATTLSMPTLSGHGSASHPRPPMGNGEHSGQSAPASTTVTYYLITKHLALLALVPTSVYNEKRGLLEYNVVFFREGVQEICNVEEEARSTTGSDA